jgi:hypothetical protein
MTTTPIQDNTVSSLPGSPEGRRSTTRTSPPPVRRNHTRSPCIYIQMPTLYLDDDLPLFRTRPLNPSGARRRLFTEKDANPADE